MIKRTCLTLLSTIRGIRIETRTLAQSNKRFFENELKPSSVNENELKSSSANENELKPSSANENELKSSSANEKLLFRDNFPFSTTCFSFSAAVQKEGTNEVSSFSLKHENARLTSAEFLTKVKESIGVSETGEEFVIPRPAFDALATEYDILLEEVASFKDKYTRALAEVENVRRRGHKQTEEAKVFAIQGFCKDLLEVADILDLAVGAVKKEELDNNISLKNLFEGLEMTRTVLQKTFVKHGLKQISPEGEKFDPALHEAVFQIPKDKTKFESGCVAQVVKTGYALQNRPIRAAKVGVVQ